MHGGGNAIVLVCGDVEPICKGVSVWLMGGGKLH